MAKQQQQPMPELVPVPTAPPIVEIVRGGEALIRTEGDQMAKLATMRPRNEGGVLDAALKELRAYPRVATEAWYSIPYKQRKDDGSEQTVLVEGPSIRAALSLARRWGNCSCRVILTDVTNEAAELEGRFLDLETNFLVSRPIRVSRIQKRRGRFVEVDEREWVQLLQASASKALRNAVLSGLPDGLVEEYVAEARRVAAPAEKKAADRTARSQKKPIAEQVTEAFAQHRLTPEDICECILNGEIASLADLKDHHLVTLRGVLNALKDGVVKPEELRKSQDTMIATEPVDLPAMDGEAGNDSLA